MSDNPSSACRICRRIILPVTARATGGLCRPCDRDEAQKRAAVQAAKWESVASRPVGREDLAALRAETGRSGAYSTILDKLYWRWQTHGLAALNPHQSNVLAVEQFLGETLNGGLAQFLGNSSGELAARVCSALHAVGCSKIAEAVTPVLGLFTDAVCSDPDARWSLFEETERQVGEQAVGHAESLVFELTDRESMPAIATRMRQYVLENATQFVWLPAPPR